jgi:hypothetical protein
MNYEPHMQLLPHWMWEELLSLDILGRLGPRPKEVVVPHDCLELRLLRWRRHEDELARRACEHMLDVRIYGHRHPRSLINP